MLNISILFFKLANNASFFLYIQEQFIISFKKVYFDMIFNRNSSHKIIIIKVQKRYGNISR